GRRRRRPPSAPRHAADDGAGSRPAEYDGAMGARLALVLACGCRQLFGLHELAAGDANGSDGAPRDGRTDGSADAADDHTSPLVPGGTFYRSYDIAPDGLFSNNAYPATISSFRLDTYEITVARFRQFVNAGEGTAADPPPRGAGARTLGGAANQGGWDSAWNNSLAPSTQVLEAGLSCGSH